MKTLSLSFVALLFLGLCPLRLQGAEQNLAKYRVVTHSSAATVNECGHLVVDGSKETYWESARSRDGLTARSDWLLIDLGTKRAIDHAVIHWGHNYGTAYTMAFLSEAGDAGREVYTTNKGSGGHQKIDCQGLKARFVRLDIARVKDPIRGCVIHEIELFGEAEERFVPADVVALGPDHLSLNGTHWRIQNAQFVQDSPQTLSDQDYDDTQWIPGQVPGTVLGSYYDFGALPDPLYGANMHQISDAFFSGNDFWYRTQVSFAPELQGKRLFLNFSGINWKSDIYFNGQLLGHIEGAFLRGEFEVTQLARFQQANVVAVLVHHPDHWVSGEFKVLRKKLNDRTTNGDMLGLDGPTSVASAGWNWLPIIRGRNIGIWNNVALRVGYDVSIQDPWVSSTLPLPDISRADLTLHTELKNHNAEPIEGVLVAEFDQTVIEYPVTLQGHETKTIRLDKSQYTALSIQDPQLWWPNGYGPQNLNDLKLSFRQQGKISDTKTLQFGIRQLDYRVVEDVLFIYCNGVRILLRGGNWGLPEAMMRCDRAGYDLRIKLHQQANFNMIRNWVGMTGHEEFYQACDRYGMLIFDDFWLANPHNGPDPRDFDLFMNNVRDKIKWVRKHPSLALYCGRNEGLPPLAYDVAMEEETQRLDGTRHYIPDSASGTLTGFGPYDVRSAQWYFENRGRTFHSEQGIVAFPEVESMRRMMPAESLWPINDMWAVHNYQKGRSDKFTNTLNRRFGEPTSVEDYCRRAQLHNYESAKAIFECLQSHQGSGVILWMSQSAWPSLICQLYDYYFEYTASYFAVKKANSPIHVFWDPLRNEIRVANNTAATIHQARVQASVVNAQGATLWEKSSSINLKPTEAKTCFALDIDAADRVRFLKLQLKVAGDIVSDNFYWIENRAGNCLDLDDLPIANVTLKVTAKRVDGYYSATIHLRNTSDSISLLNKIKVKDRGTGESILPVFFDDDYVSLLPGEETTLHMSVDEDLLKDRKADIHLEGWNTKTAILACP